MKLQWLNLILHTTSVVYRLKQKLLPASLFLSMVFSLEIVFLELFLLIISLPTYFFIRADYSPVSIKKEDLAHYRYRRKFTLSLLMALASLSLAWLILDSILIKYFFPIDTVSQLLPLTPYL